MNRARTLTILLLMASALPVAGQARRYTITDLGTLGGDRSNAVSINNAGRIVGKAETADGNTHAFLVQDGVMIDLGTLGGKQSEAMRISDSGVVIGRAQAADGTFHSFVSLGGSELWDISAIDDRLKDRFSVAVGINSAGHVVGYVQTHTEHMAARTRVFLFRDFRITDLGTFGGEDGVVAAINDAGDVVGYFGLEPHADYADHRGALMSNGVVTNLGSLGGRITTPTDLNNSKNVVGFAQLKNGEDHAFLYSAGRLLDLGTLPGGSQSFAYAINDKNQIVGAANGHTLDLRAVLFENGRVIDLNALLPDNSGWVLTEARDINDRGQIVGTGVINGRQRAFLLTPP
jgi:probable HAF family extracellular repeat protein